MHPRRKIFQEQVAMMKWKIKYSDIVFDNHVSLISVNKVSRLGTQSETEQALYKYLISFIVRHSL